MFAILTNLCDAGMQTLRQAVDGSELPNARIVSMTINEDRNVPSNIHTCSVPLKLHSS